MAPVSESPTAVASEIRQASLSLPPTGSHKARGMADGVIVPSELTTGGGASGEGHMAGFTITRDPQLYMGSSGYLELP